MQVCILLMLKGKEKSMLVNVSEGVFESLSVEEKLYS